MIDLFGKLLACLAIAFILMLVFDFFAGTGGLPWPS
jgi:hypothetical protein